MESWEKIFFEVKMVKKKEKKNRQTATTMDDGAKQQ